MLTHRTAFVVAAAVLACVPSCALRQHLVVRYNKLKAGQTYEVRKAVAAGDEFRPHLMSSYFFVVESPRPPLLAAGAAASASRVSQVRTTAYCHDESDHLQYGRLSAVGTFLKYGAVRSAAADWSRYPAGTRFRIASEPGVIYEVDDYGSALVGTGTIDLYRPTRGQMNAWGMRHVDIEVLQWGCFERSRQLLQGRTRYPHVREMYQNIQRKLGQADPSTKITPVTAMTAPSTASAEGLSPST